jgi:hypothetical protein
MWTLSGLRCINLALSDTDELSYTFVMQYSRRQLVALLLLRVKSLFGEQAFDRVGEMTLPQP